MHFHDKQVLRAVQGLGLSLLSPLGWLIIRLLLGYPLIDELTVNSGIYWYLITGTAGAFVFFGYYVGSHEERLEDLTIRDALTGLYNNRFFHARLPEEFARCQRHKQHISLILIDLDHFKRVNDQYGHQSGDVVLQEVAKIMQQTARKEEFVARVGGEEFCVILVECGEKEALLAAERFIEAIRQMQVVLPGGESIRITASLGVVSSETTEGNEWHLYAVADAAMYRAKKSGRNQIAIV
jgi:diguanylate cyclase (GGDEF)-like protein